MAQRSTSFLVVLLLIFYGEVSGQKNPHFGEKNLDKRSLLIRNHITEMVNEEKQLLELSLLYLKCNHNMIGNRYKYVHVRPDCNYAFCDPIVIGGYRYQITGANYMNQLGFFCKKEIQLDKITALPIRFRLGSLNYVNWMEQKPNAVKF